MRWGRVMGVLVALMGGARAELVVDDTALTRQRFGAALASPDGLRLATRYTNGQLKVDGHFRRQGSDAIPVGPVRIWYPNGQLRQQFDPTTNTVTTWHESGPLIEEERAPLVADADYVTTRYFTTGQMRERTVERFSDVKQRIVFYYGFGWQDALTPTAKLSTLRRYTHSQFLLKEAWYPSGGRLYVAKYDPEAPLSRRTTYTFYTPDGAVDEDTRHFYQPQRDGRIPAGWIKHGVHREYADDGRVRSEITYDMNRKAGRLRYWHGSGQLSVDAMMDGDRALTRVMYDPDGWLTHWTEVNGATSMRLSSAGTVESFEARFGSGEVRYAYGEDGALRFQVVRLPYSRVTASTTDGRHEGRLVDRRPVGPWRYLRADGTRIAEVAHDARGRLTGVARQWHANGQLAVECRFAAGLPDGPIRTFFADGTPAMEGQFTAGMLTGRQRTWGEDGRLREDVERGPKGGVVRIRGRWRPDGSPEVLETRDDANARFVTTRYHLGKVISREFRGDGRRTIDREALFPDGVVKQRTLHLDDDPEHTEVTTFWPSGTRKTRTIRKGKPGRGAHETWHANGTPATRVRFDEKGTQGVMASWSEAGVALADRHFVDGVEQVQPSSDPCFCNQAWRSPARFLNLAERFLEGTKIETALPGVTLEGYDKTFLRSDSMNNGYTSGDLVSMGPLALRFSGLRVLLNPCRHGANHSKVPVQARAALGEPDDVRVTLSPERIAIEVPSAALQAADGPWRFTAKGQQLMYDTHQGVALKQGAVQCAPPARVGGTGLVMNLNGGGVSLTGKGAAPVVEIVGGRFEFVDHLERKTAGVIQSTRFDAEGMTVRLIPQEGPDGGFEAMRAALAGADFAVAIDGQGRWTVRRVRR